MRQLKLEGRLVLRALETVYPELIAKAMPPSFIGKEENQSLAMP
ncbi:MAG: hypothetical protein ACR9NN_06550 [Nostochopsis sp.]